jgi:hypothetical protein
MPAVRSSGESDFKLPVHVAPVSDSDDIDNALSVINAVHDSVVADSDSPEPVCASQLARTRRPRVDGKSFDASQNACNN